MRALAVIPARFASERLPGKPLVKLDGKPLVEWVYTTTVECNLFERVIVATESEEVVACVLEFGGSVELTGQHHRTGTDRVAEVAERYPGCDVVANVQADQPFLTTRMLEELLTPYVAGESPDMTTLACPLVGDPDDPNVVKVVCDQNGDALYFSRSRIPFSDVASEPALLHHLGLYAFRADFLTTFSALRSSPLERAERLEQLRALEHGYRIRVCRTEGPTLEINTPEEWQQAQAHLSRSSA